MSHQTAGARLRELAQAVRDMLDQQDDHESMEHYRPLAVRGRVDALLAALEAERPEADAEQPEPANSDTARMDWFEREGLARNLCMDNLVPNSDPVVWFIHEHRAGERVLLGDGFTLRAAIDAAREEEP